MYLITIIVLLVIVFAIWYTIRRVEGFFDSSASASGLASGTIIVPPVDYGFAMRSINNNLTVERNVISQLVPYYEKIIGIAASNKVDPSKYSSKEELRVAINNEKPAIRTAVEKEGKGRVIPLYDIDRALKAITGVPDEVKYAVSYMYLPLEVELYKTTAEFLNTKCLDIIKYFSSFDNTGFSKIKGSTPASLGATISGFQDINVSSASIKAKGNLQDILNQFTIKDQKEKIVIDQSQIQDLYRISTTRIRRLEELALDKTIIIELSTNFGKLDQLMKQLEEGNDKAYAAIMVEGKGPIDAINAFTDFGSVPFAYLDYGKNTRS